MLQWEEIRAARDDLTDYVVHFTKSEYISPIYHHAKDRLKSILQCGHIKPTFAPMGNRYKREAQPTIQGPDPVVCLTEQPLSAFLKTPHKRYSNYGIAYHKVALYNAGGRPVLYATQAELNALPDSLKYLWVRYSPIFPGRGEGYPIDFTWEREWRYKGDLKVLLDTDWMRRPKGVLIVDRDSDVAEVGQLLAQLARDGTDWANHLTRIISLETAKKRIDEGDVRYHRIETWPDEPSQERATSTP
jgi:Putative abortive phage resistance protein AbiGi, antitoxin